MAQINSQGGIYFGSFFVATAAAGRGGGASSAVLMGGGGDGLRAAFGRPLSFLAGLLTGTQARRYLVARTTVNKIINLYVIRNSRSRKLISEKAHVSENSIRIEIRSYEKNSKSQERKWTIVNSISEYAFSRS